MPQSDASMSQKDASISSISRQNQPRADASRSRSSKGSESSSSSSSPQPPRNNAATRDYTDEVERQRLLTEANLRLLRQQEEEKRRIAAENVKKELAEIEAEQRMGQRPRYTAVKSMAKPEARARVKSEPNSVKSEPKRRTRSRSVKIEPKAEDTSKPRGRPPTKVKLEDGTENTSKRGRPPGSKNKPK